MFSALKTSLQPLRHPVTLFLLAIGSVMVTVLGPFNTFGNEGFAARLLYWAVAIYGSTAISLSLKGIVSHLLPSVPVWLYETVVVSAMTAVFSPLLLQWTRLMFPEGATAGISLWFVMYYVFWITVMITLIRQAILSVVPKPEQKAAPTTARILRRLPKEFEGPILRVSVRDHFVEVVGPSAVETLRMRFSDALGELEGLDGTVTHRSHWVAKRAVVETCHDNGKTRLVLVNGDRVPVSRTYRPKLSDIGML